MASEGDYFSPKVNQGADTETTRPRRNHTSSSLRIPSFRHRPSNQSRLGSAQDASRLQPTESARSQRSYQGSSNGRTSGADSRQSGAETARQNEKQLKRQQTEKKTEESFYVDNDYYSLNPWYENQPARPLFGLGRPFPRTVRPGMLWGRKKTQVNQDPHGSDDNRNFGPPIKVTDEQGQDPGPPPDVFITDINGYPVEVRRVSPREADEEESDGIERHDHADPDPSEESLQKTESAAQRNHTPGFQSTLSPLKEDDTASIESSQTQEEKKEIESREEQAIHEFYNAYRNPLARLRARCPEAPAEFLATTIYVFFGIAGNLYSVTYPAEKGDYQTQAWAWAFAVTAGIYVGGGISGAHLNPWLSVCFSVYRGFPWKMCLIYSAAQMLAGFVAGALAWGIYREAIYYTDPKLTPDITGLAFYAIPQTYVSTSTAFFNCFLSSAFYVCIAFALGDDSNTPPGAGMSALIYGFMTYLLSITMGYNGLGISPARDLGPRCVAWWVGYGRDTFATGWWAYGPIAAGLGGSLCGALLYDICIFAGGESPVNYAWPGPGDIKARMKARKQQAKEKLDQLPV